MKNKTIFFSFVLSVLCVLLSHRTLASGPWVKSEGQRGYSFTYVSEMFDEKWLADEKSGIAEISQTTLWFGFEYGLNDQVQLSLMTGHSSTEFDASTVDFSGRADSRLSAKYLWLEEVAGQPLTLAVQSTAIFKGNYPRSYAGNPHSPGDKANGVEVSFPYAKSLGTHFVLMGDIGYRLRSDDVPDDLFYSLGIAGRLGENVSLLYKYSVVDGQDGLDIGQAPFTPNDFHRTEEDQYSHELNISISFLRSWTLFAGTAEVLDGRNTGASEIVFMGLSWQN